jgi:hypothetical protein
VNDRRQDVRDLHQDKQDRREDVRDLHQDRQQARTRQAK